jgi:hypothetical protein
MKKILVILAIGVSSASAQTMYKLESIPVYDEEGNVYQMRSVYDHLPTSADSAEFFAASRTYVYTTSKELKKEQGAKFYTIKVGQIKYDTNGNLLVKPTEKFRSEWYRCQDKKVKVGDTILITKDDAVQ